MKHSLGKDWTILVKAHPHDRDFYEKLQLERNIVINLNECELNQILSSVDCLVTDYSSVPFEYSLARKNGKMIFFCYDLYEYSREVGIESDFFEWAPGPIVQTQEELIDAIQKEPRQNFELFNQEWNEYATGKSLEQLVAWIRRKFNE